jgi:predicted nucleotidyltransferase
MTMKKEEVLRILAANREKLKKFSVKSLSLFGSVARDEATDASDVDLLVEFEAGAHIGLLDFIGLKLLLEDILGRKVDLGVADTLRERIRDRVLREAIRVA